MTKIKTNFRKPKISNSYVRGPFTNYVSTLGCLVGQPNANLISRPYSVNKNANKVGQKTAKSC